MNTASNAGFFQRMTLVMMASLVVHGCLATTTPRPQDAASAQRWTDRLIPLPKNITVAGSVTVTVENIFLELPNIKDSREKTIRGLLSTCAKGNRSDATARIVLQLVAWQDAGLPAAVRCLESVPNHDQAYAIIHEANNNRHVFRLLASTPEGLLYAARTFAGLVSPQGLPAGLAAVELPLVTITDWPDMQERGWWGSNGHYNLAWHAQWKLNLHVGHCTLQFDMRQTNALTAGRWPSLMIVQSNEQAQLVAHATEVGIRLVPIIPHIGDGQMKLIRDIQNEPALAFARDILAQEGPQGEKARGLCMSNPRTTQLLSDAFVQVVALSSSAQKPCEIWLTEGGNVQCHCHECRGRNGYVLEAAGIIKAYKSALRREPALQLRLMSSQGSYPVDPQIIKLLPPGAGFVYYNGFLSYSADHQPLIPDYITEFAKTGHYVSAYMDANPSFFAVFPGSMPQFIRFRARELCQKRLSGVEAYCVPDRHFYEVNMAALAEWTWNMNGRSVSDFARAFATITGGCEPELYANWIEHAGEAAWWLADSRFIEALCYQPKAITQAIVPQYPVGDVRCKVYPIPELDRTLQHARAAMDLAIRSGNVLMQCESACVLAGLYAYELAEAIRQDNTQGASPAEMELKINRLEIYAQQIRGYHDAWYYAIVSNKAALPKSPLYPMFGKTVGETYKVPRLSMPEYALFRACDAWRTQLKLPLPIVGRWSYADFGTNGQAHLSFDATSLAPSHATGVSVFLEWGGGDTIHTKSMTLVVSNSQSGMVHTGALNSLSRRLNNRTEERFFDETFALPPRNPADRLLLQVNLEIPEITRPLRYNPLTDGVLTAVPASLTNIDGRILVRPVWLKGETGARDLSAVNPWKQTE